MRSIIFVLALSTLVLAAAGRQTFTGTVTDSMCVMNHQMMKITPESRCARECVRSKNAKYVLFDGKNVYRLSDQQTPERFAAQRAKVTGMFYEKTGIIKVEKIEPAK